MVWSFAWLNRYSIGMVYGCRHRYDLWIIIHGLIVDGDTNDISFRLSLANNDNDDNTIEYWFRFDIWNNVWDDMV